MAICRQKTIIRDNSPCMHKESEDGWGLACYSAHWVLYGLASLHCRKLKAQQPPRTMAKNWRHPKGTLRNEIARTTSHRPEKELGHVSCGMLGL